MLKLIYASDVNGVIGIDNKLPWRLPSDLKLFKNKTKGKTVVMGRNTYDSLPDNSKPLPDRVNIVLTHSHTKIGSEVLNLSLGMKEVYELSADHDFWVIGGASVYRQALPYVDEIHHTAIHLELESNPNNIVFTWDDYKDSFELIEQTYHCEDIDKGVTYNHRVYRRKKTS